MASFEMTQQTTLCATTTETTKSPENVQTEIQTTERIIHSTSRLTSPPPPPSSPHEETASREPFQTETQQIIERTVAHLLQNRTATQNAAEETTTAQNTAEALTNLFVSLGFTRKHAAALAGIIIIITGCAITIAFAAKK